MMRERENREESRGNWSLNGISQDALLDCEEVCAGMPDILESLSGADMRVNNIFVT